MAFIDWSLMNAYRHQHEANELLLASSDKVIAVTSNTVPVELIRANC